MVTFTIIKWVTFEWKCPKCCTITIVENSVYIWSW